ncbi:MAG: glycosyltransferase family 2 protein, partial [Candidatus Staskawiczbacteria bacterium]|nr:glycosyltransferase family 2 protein [Candidatus Staskawiczbacteria bacterium]
MSYCDIIIPVKDNLSDFKPCLESILKYTNYPYKIIIINDGSDKNTSAYLERITSENKNITLLTNDRNLGFLKSANKGISISSAPYMLILNTDTIVTSDWLAKMVKCAESDSKIGIVNPISTNSQNLSIDIPLGENIFSFAEKLDSISKKTYPDIVTAVGFCFMITRQAFNRLGFFDEIYGFGYYEESDYCMRAIKNGIRVVACDDAFVYHRGKASFVKQDSKNLKSIHKNRKIFFSRWKKLYYKSLKKFNKNNPFLYIRSHFYELKKFWIIKRVIYYFNKFNYLRGKRGFSYAAYRVCNFLNRLRRKEIVYFYPFESSKQHLKSDSTYCKPKIAFVFEELSLCGGVIFLVELINQLILDG